ncbi:MAG TPA: ABC transporter ATP-binding protein [Ktedonobacterales bacterium]|jgi:ABC-2 type transport system ATP-binding protein
MGTAPAQSEHEQRQEQNQAGEMVLSTHALTKRYGETLAVDSLDLEVRRGDIVGFLGPNGAGKTTTIRMLTGLIQPTSGDILLFGTRLKKQRTALLQRVGALVESPPFYPYLSGADNLRVAASASGMLQDKATARRIAELLELVSLGDHPRAPFRRYSQGMKQRLGIAAALLADPELLILDEPTTSLDPAGIVEFRSLLTRLAAQGKTVFLSSHQLSEVQVLCNRVAILNKGRLLYQGTVSDLLHKHIGQRMRVVIGFETGEALQAALALLRAEWTGAAKEWLLAVKHLPDQQHGQILVEAKTGHAGALNALLARQNLFASELHRVEMTLEQYFLTLTTAPSGNQPPGASDQRQSQMITHPPVAGVVARKL